MIVRRIVMRNTETLCFSDIFEDYSQFKEFTDQFELVESADDDLINQKIYYCLLNRYGESSIAYLTAGEFCGEFGIAYMNYFKKIKQQQKILQDIYNLDADDFEILSESQTNMSNHPNANTSDPFELLNFTSSQARGRSRVNKLTAYINALRNMPDLQLDYMIKQFDYMWLDILESNNIYYY